MAANASECARYYEEMGKKEGNPEYKLVYGEWQRAMEYYSRHPNEHPYYEPVSPWRPRTARAAFVGLEGAPNTTGWDRIMFRVRANHVRKNLGD